MPIKFQCQFHSPVIGFTSLNVSKHGEAIKLRSNTFIIIFFILLSFKLSINSYLSMSQYIRSIAVTFSVLHVQRLVLKPNVSSSMIYRISASLDSAVPFMRIFILPSAIIPILIIVNHYFFYLAPLYNSL